MVGDNLDSESMFPPVAWRLAAVNRISPRYCVGVEVEIGEFLLCL